MTINHGLTVLHVTKAGADVVGAPVYLFTPAGSYLGKSESTDANGIAEFLLPDQQYKFRVDCEGSQYWSDVVTIISYEENDIELNLDLLTLDLTNDPNPAKYHGIAPELEQEKPIVALLSALPGLWVDAAYAQGGTEKLYFFINDHLGTPQKVMDENGAVVWSADYRPFGDANITVNTLENNVRFPGQYYDGETGLHYNYHRYYNSSIGRYLRADPLGIFGGDTNLYAYVVGNPLAFYDAFGLEVYLGSRAKKPYRKQHGMLRHSFIHIKNDRLPGGEGYFGLYSNFIVGPGKIAENDDWDVNWEQHDGRLVEIDGVDEDKLIDEILEDIKNPPFYFLIGNNCQDWVKEKIEDSRKRDGNEAGDRK